MAVKLAAELAAAGCCWRCVLRLSAVNDSAAYATARAPAAAASSTASTCASTSASSAAAAMAVETRDVEGAAEGASSSAAASSAAASSAAASSTAASPTASSSAASSAASSSSSAVSSAASSSSAAAPSDVSAEAEAATWRARPCAVCLGVLQRVEDADAVAEIVERTRAAGYDGTSFAMSVTIPASTITRQRGMLAHMAAKGCVLRARHTRARATDLRIRAFSRCAPRIRVPLLHHRGLTERGRGRWLVVHGAWGRLRAAGKTADLKDTVRWALGPVLATALGKTLDANVRGCPGAGGPQPSVRPS